MTATDARFKIAPQVVREAFDDEVIIIDMGSGNYFSLNPSGAAVWSLIEEGHDFAGLVDRLCRRHSEPRASIEAQVGRLLDRLLEEKLIETTDTRPSAVPSAADAQAAANRVPFGEPELAVYTDMQELLLLDPIHDVDETGWPKRPEEAKE